MNKDIFMGNKIIYQKMHRKQRLRHLNKLNQIKTKPSSLYCSDPPYFKHTFLAPDSQKHLQVERNNIALFNKIATILKEKPKVQFPRTRNFVKSLDEAMYKQQRKMLELKLKNENLARRLNKQQPTIKNELLFRDRAKHERYLSFIGKYPFKPFRRTQTQFQISTEEQEQREQVYHQRTLDFDITINRRQDSGEYVFRVRDLNDEREYVTVMEAEKFREEMTGCEMSYERMVGRLRMEKNGQMRFVEAAIALKSQQSIAK